MRARIEAGNRARREREVARRAEIQSLQEAWENGGREKWAADHAEPECEHGNPPHSNCCRDWETPTSAYDPNSPPALKVKRCRRCGGSGASDRSGVDLCAACWGSGHDD